MMKKMLNNDKSNDKSKKGRKTACYFVLKKFQMNEAFDKYIKIDCLKLFINSLNITDYI